MPSPAGILSVDSLLGSIQALLPSSTPTLLQPADVLVSLIHAIHVALGFRLSRGSDADPKILPDNWNSHGPDSYKLEYKHEQSSMTYVVKVGTLGSNRINVDAMAVEDDKPTHISLTASEYLNPSGVPLYPLAVQAVADGGSEIPASTSTSILATFVSKAKVEDFIALYKRDIIVKYIPGLQKEGYEEGPRATPASSSQQTSQQRLDTQREPLMNPGLPNIPPYLGRNPSGSYAPPSLFPSIGGADLDPLAASPNAFRPPAMFPGAGGGIGGGPNRNIPGGMQPDFNHPIFDPRHGIAGGGHGAWGGDGFLPPGAVPPGARFDPIGPSAGGGGGMGRIFNGEPDNDEFMPPGLDGPNFGLPGGRNQGGRGGGGGFGGFGGAGAGNRDMFM